jgi:PKD repeat protein
LLIKKITDWELNKKYIFMKKFTVLLVLIIAFIYKGNSQGLENFNNSNATSSYADNNFEGENGVTWYYVKSRDGNGDANGSGIALPALMLRRVTDGSKVFSSTISGGIGNFSIKLYKGFTGGGNRQVELFINDVSYGTSTVFDDFDEHIFSVNDINVPGDIVIRIDNITAKQIIVDDITWTGYGGAASVATPIITPASGDYFDPINVSMSTSTDGASIYYTTNGDDPTDGSTLYSTPFAVSTTTTVKAIAYKAGMTESGISENNYTFPAVTEVANIAALRTQTIGDDYYRLTGEAVITFQQSYRNQKYIQDATAAVLVDDDNDVITTTYDLYDGVTGILGTLSEYGGMLQFIPSADPGVATSTANTITPQIISIAQLTSNFEAYEAELVKVEGVTFADAGADFATGTPYVINDGVNPDYNFRTSFYSVDYIGTAIPAGPQDLVMLPNSRPDGEYATSRSLADIQAASGGNSAVKLDITSINGGNPITEGQPFTVTVQAQDVNGAAANVDVDVNVTLSVGTGSGTLAGTITGTITSGGSTVTISDVTYSPFETGVILNVVDDASNLTAGNSDAFDVLEMIVVDLKISEIMYNAMGGTDTLEYFEIYNNGDDAVNLEGFEITEGVSHTFGDVTINAGAYLVMSINAENIQNAFGVSSVEWTSGGLKNGGEDIVIIDTYDNVVAFVDYDDGGEWPLKETGKSIRFCDPSLDNNDPANWSISVEYLATIEGEDKFGTPGAACGEANPAAQLDIVDVNSGDIIYDGEPFSVTIQSQDAGGIVANVDTDVNVTLTVGTGTGTIGGTFTGTIASGTNSVTISGITYSPFETGVVLNANDDASNLTTGNSDAFNVNEIIILDVVINEIMYNSIDVDEEWIELYNSTDAVIDLENWTLIDDDPSHDPIVITADYSIAVGDYFTISIATGGNFPFTPDFDGTGYFNLNNNLGDIIYLINDEGFIVDSVAFSDDAPWPTEPDGNGPTLALLDPTLNNDLVESWAASSQNGGTPGAINFPSVPVIALSTPNGGEIIQQDTDFEITWTSANIDGNIKIELFRDGQTAIELATDVDITLGTYSWSVEETLEVADDYKVSITSLDDATLTDESDAVFSIIEYYDIPVLVFTEIMYNPPESGDDSLEFIEIYNNGTEIVNLEGFSFTQGFEYVFPEMEIAPDAYLLLAIDSVAMNTVFNVDAFQWTSGALSNGGEDIELVDIYDNVIDFVEYDDAFPWDTLADGYGNSLTLCNPDVDNNVGENWTHSEYFIAQNSNNDSIWATPGFGCQISLLAQLEADETLILVGESVQFTDLTIGTPTSWSWTFEGGTPATFEGQNPPAVTYSNAGDWDVSLTVGDGITTHSITYEEYIRVGVVPVADFEATLTTVTVGSYTNFTNTSIGEDLTYEWYFEGGTPETSTSEDPGDIYYNLPDVTTYDVRLIVSNEFGIDTLTRVDYINTIADGIGESNLNENTFKVYPNPAVSTLTISVPENNDIKIEIYSMEGKLIMSKFVRTTETINIESFENGMYLIRATDTENKNSVFEKLIKN